MVIFIIVIAWSVDSTLGAEQALASPTRFAWAVAMVRHRDG
jgi:hypothetical protein